MDFLLLGMMCAPARTSSFKVSAMITSILAEAVIAKNTESPNIHNFMFLFEPFGLKPLQVRLASQLQ